MYSGQVKPNLRCKMKVLIGLAIVDLEMMMEDDSACFIASHQGSIRCLH